MGAHIIPVGFWFCSPSHLSIMIRLLVVLCLLFSLSSALFFGNGQAPRSSCQYNNQCPRTRRCITRNDLFCGLGNIFGGRRRNCSYKSCAECNYNGDCRYGQECLGSSCVARAQDRNYNYNYNTPSYNTPAPVQIGLPERTGEWTFRG